MINTSYKCIFIEVPKTGSTSIRKIIGQPPQAHLDIKEVKDYIKRSMPDMQLPMYSYANLIYKTLPIHQWKNRRSEQIFNNYFKFGFVRNPWSRTVSLYLRRQGIQMRNKMTFDEFVDWIQLSSDTCRHPSPKRNQLDWFLDEDQNVVVDFIGRFENLEQDWSYIAKQLNISSSLPHLNKNDDDKKRKHYSEYYTNKTKRIIAQKFAKDIEYFNYTFV